MQMGMGLGLTLRRGWGAVAFSPISLFSAGEQGVWYEPSDMNTMFTDRAGITPVTTPGQTVGLRLDKSKGLVLGSELIANGDFSGGSTGWTITASGTNTITISSGSVRFVTNGSADAATLSQPWSGATAVGKYYRITFDVLSGSTGQLKITTLGVSTVIGEHTFTATPGAKSFTLVSANVTNIGISRVVGQSADATIDNISVKEIPGNHAVAPTDAARPTYGIEPKTGRRNLLLATDVMATQSLTVTAVAHTLSFTGTGTVTLTGASTAGPLVGTGANNRVSLTFTPSAASLTLTVSGSVTLAQLELGSTATAYQRVGTAFDVTEAGVSTVHYVQYDGTDDSFSTSSINFTATDKMSVFAGVRKLSDAAQGVLAELSATIVSNNGSFLLAAPDGATATFGFDSKGTTQVDAVASSLTAPITRLVTGLADIAGDTTTIRINGVQTDQDTGDQGTGNYGNYPLYIGRRNNATLPFNGRDYGVIIVGKTASASEIYSTESYLAANTSGVSI